MLEKNIAFISNYFWKESINNINKTLLGDAHSFNMNDYYYLTEIYQSGKPKLGELALRLNLTKPAISAMVRRLEKNGLVERIQSGEDKRIFYLNLTEKGLKIIEGDYQLYEKLSNLFNNTFSTEQIDMLSDSLDKVVCKLTEEAGVRRIGESK